MNTGKTLFAQLMDFLPWTSFTRMVNRYGGDRYVKSLTISARSRGAVVQSNADAEVEMSTREKYKNMRMSIRRLTWK
jgi:hypothetical protein